MLTAKTRTFSSRMFVILHSGWLKTMLCALVIVLLLSAVLYKPYTKGAIRTQNGNRVVLKLEVSNSFAKRSKGLAKRDKLCANCGMLFVYKGPIKLTFWMKDTKIPLDIAFLDSDMKIQEIIRDMQPFSQELIRSTYASSYAIEVNKGYFDKHNVAIGDRLLVNLQKK